MKIFQITVISNNEAIISSVQKIVKGGSSIMLALFFFFLHSCSPMLRAPCSVLDALNSSTSKPYTNQSTYHEFLVLTTLPCLINSWQIDKGKDTIGMATIKKPLPIHMTWQTVGYIKMSRKTHFSLQS